MPPSKPTDEDEGFDSDDLPETRPPEKELSRRQAAAKLKVDPRTIVRWVKSGILKQTANQKFLPSELEDFIRRSKQDPDMLEDDDEPNYWQEMTQALAQLTQHNERLLSLIDKPLNMVLTMLTTSNAQYAARVADSDKAYLEAMKLLGEQLMAKEDREAKAGREAVKTALFAQAGDNIMGLLPVLIQQVMTRKGSVKLTPEEQKQVREVMGVEDSSAVLSFLAALDENDLKRMSLLRGALSGEKQVLFDAAMAELNKGSQKNG